MSSPATTAPPDDGDPADGDPHRSPVPVLDVGVAVASAATSVGWRLARRTYAATTPVTAPVTRTVRAAATTVSSVAPAPPAWLGTLAEQGAARRHAAAGAASALVDAAVSTVATQAFKRLDLAGLIRQYVDLDEVVDGVDAVKLTQDVIVAVDLPDIIRTSTGSMASDTVRGVRMQGVSADAAVARLVDHVLPRRARARGPATQDDAAPGPQA